jgi:hypothetical protein
MLVPWKPRTSGFLILKHLKNWNCQILAKSNTHPTLAKTTISGTGRLYGKVLIG